MGHVRTQGAAVVDVSSSASQFLNVREVSLKMTLASRLGLVVLLLLASTAGQSGYPSSFVIQAVADEPASECVVQESEGQTTCTCLSTEAGKPKVLQATLSAAKSALQLVCQSDLKCAPDGLSEKQVCPESTTDLKDCKANGPTECVNVTTLLTGNIETVRWEEVNVDSKNPKPKRLTIPTENLPYTDKKFIVGCLDKEGNNAKCKLTVTLEARESVTENQTVTCAYGKTSNPTHQTITLSPSQNSFTLVCGSEGEVLPTEYQNTYCVSQAGTNASAECCGNYTEVIPAYESNWWKEDRSSHSFTLAIPEDGFPEEATNITVGCQQKGADTSNNARDEAVSDSPTVCSVDVTIEGVTSSASSVGTAGAFSFLGGFAALLTGLGPVM
ncbi:srs domain-containing protein [Neospora caninum Liverpool]|uniref:Srs domain-containing protein n=1 Tax=Neospora caninum (strain Liverpool) TaxID=572307 RepID=F0VAW2_NEOCL|nr:srs domain-containing protein [Neospora caninum Liverpool]CBZ50820.1 srs domain-containing protein [Neospora caninum Liverpool]CEL68121.1 TPA: SRS domain-containing protein [Neospora caninum Liverpool]|eukprot:XP_003880853.1 srs domain-containing protein [Neospora caninum Liverpool]